MDGEFNSIGRGAGQWAVILIPVMLASCQVTSQAVQSRTPNSPDRLSIIYCTDSPTGPLFTAAPTDPSNHFPAEIVQAAARVPSDAAEFQNLQWSKVELRIEYPHPDGRRDYARVTLRALPVQCGDCCDRVSWNRRVEDRREFMQTRRDAFRERLLNVPQRHSDDGTYTEMDLPRAELDSILAELNGHGFFSEIGNAPGSTSQLEVRLNRRWTSKAWQYEPRLDQLTTRVYEQGLSHTLSDPVDSLQPAPRSAGLMPFGHSQ